MATYKFLFRAHVQTHTRARAHTHTHAQMECSVPGWLLSCGGWRAGGRPRRSTDKRVQMVTLFHVQLDGRGARAVRSLAAAADDDAAADAAAAAAAVDAASLLRLAAAICRQQPRVHPVASLAILSSRLRRCITLSEFRRLLDSSSQLFCFFHFQIVQSGQRIP